MAQKETAEAHGVASAVIGASDDVNLASSVSHIQPSNGALPPGIAHALRTIERGDADLGIRMLGSDSTAGERAYHILLIGAAFGLQPADTEDATRDEWAEVIEAHIDDMRRTLTPAVAALLETEVDLEGSAPIELGVDDYETETRGELVVIEDAPLPALMDEWPPLHDGGLELKAAILRGSRFMQDYTVPFQNDVGRDDLIVGPELTRTLGPIASTFGWPLRSTIYAALGAVSMGLGAAVEVKVSESHSEDALLWIAVVAESGLRKSALFRRLCKSLIEVESEVQSEARSQRGEYTARLRRLKEVELAAKQADDAEGLAEAIKERIAFEADGPPHMPVLILSDTTPEALFRPGQHQRCICLSDDEGVHVLRTGKYDTGGGGGATSRSRLDQAKLSKLWDGGNIVNATVQGGVIPVGRLYSPMFVACQPDIYRAAVADQSSLQSGFVPRWLAISEENFVEMPDHDERSALAMQEFDLALYRLSTFGIKSALDKGYTPHRMEVSEEGRQFIRAWFEKASVTADNSELENFRTVIRRMPGVMIRVAAVSRLIETELYRGGGCLDALGEPLTAAELETAARLCTLSLVTLQREALGIGQGSVSDRGAYARAKGADKAAVDAIGLLAGCNGADGESLPRGLIEHPCMLWRFTDRTPMRKLWRGWANLTGDERDEAFEVLCRHGVIRPSTQGGASRIRSYIVNPTLSRPKIVE